MNQETRQLLSRARFELEYQSGRAYPTTFDIINKIIKEKYENNLITRRKMANAKSLNIEIYQEVTRE